MIKIIPNKQYFLKRTSVLTESSQGTKYLAFSLLNDKNEPFHPYFMCKDYFQDLFLYYYMYNDGVTNENSKKEAIFGFQPELFFREILQIKNNFKICLKVQHSNKNINDFCEKFDIENINETIRVLNYFEELLNFPLTTYEITEDLTTVIFDFSKKWTERPYLISAYLLILRGVLRKQIDNITAIDLKNLDTLEDFLKSIDSFFKIEETKAYSFARDKRSFYKSKEVIETILMKETLPAETWDKYLTSLMDCHMNSGCVSVSSQIKILNKMKKNKEVIV